MRVAMGLLRSHHRSIIRKRVNEDARNRRLHANQHCGPGELANKNFKVRGQHRAAVSLDHVVAVNKKLSSMTENDEIRSN
mmetsp:Transcript_5417/g.8531  ORF Transcript_5417/g.8531 Transcript_5417/m.8531 type:complete len:80 (-) Transcript_5417:396-635(-)